MPSPLNIALFDLVKGKQKRLFVPVSDAVLNTFTTLLGTWLLLPCSAAECRWRKSTSRCSTSKIRTPHTLLNGSPTMSRLPSVTSHHVASRWLQPSLVTPLPSRSCSSVSLSNSLPCSGARLSCIGTLAKVRFFKYYFSRKKCVSNSTFNFVTKSKAAAVQVKV